MKKFSKILAIVLAIATLGTVLCFSLVACNKNNKQTDAEYILEKGTLVCGITLYEPMNYADADGEMTGFDTEFAEAVCEKLGLKAKFQVIKWSSKEIELNSKYIDCIWNGFTVNEERKQNLDFTQSYLNNTQCVVVKDDKVSTYTTKESLSSKTGAAESGSAGESAAKEMTKNVTSVQAQMTALQELAAGNVDFAVVDVILANAVVGTGSFNKLAVDTNIALESEEYAIGFRKGSDMVAKVNAVINELLADGTLETIAKKYKLDGQLIK